ncbi:NAD-P-binding protein [Mycena filopes]|nr:NAD-P-binding protein [Mycena filopes]
MSVVLITGCSAGGIGFTMYVSFCAPFFGLYKFHSQLDRCGEFASRGCDEADVNRVVADIIKKEGRIDIAVNNAGMACPILEVPVEDIRNVYDTNILSIVRVSRAVLPHMAKNKSGLILNIGSVSGPTPWCGVYASSKAAVHSISEVMLVCPGGVKTNLQPNSLYQEYLPNIVKRMWGSQGPTSISSAGKSLSSDPLFYVTMGANSTTFAILKWLPRKWVLNFMWKMCTGPVKE